MKAKTKEVKFQSCLVVNRSLFDVERYRHDKYYKLLVDLHGLVHGRGYFCSIRGSFVTPKKTRSHEQHRGRMKGISYMGNLISFGNMLFKHLNLLS